MLPAGQAVVITAISPDPDVSTGIHLYPNPVRASLTLDSLKLSDKWESLDIMSVDGNRRIARFSIAGKTKVSLDIAHLSNGYYLAVLRRTNGQTVVKRFIKM